ncbi:hypothetical protein [Corynebacterium sp. TAE3-ERU16]|uniref:hypothetical protein n=1 Tax=Corynebacterium sp. TAE3-ERU16 TaxID=2849493 RepID=UPI001C46C7F2|nr:hypothetical protein [Corynebacterium sp. TAE3-ERU16]MBV7292684.1 hypothetical protein [Corynebacterium sp. TAE3-ERU16]
MKGTLPCPGDAEDADTGVRMLDGAVEDYRAVVEELCAAARGTWTGPRVTPEELAETTGTVRGFNPTAVLESATAAGGSTWPEPVVDRVSEVIDELGDEGIGKLIGDRLGAVATEYLEHRTRQDQALDKAARAISANATLCRMSGEAAGVTARATLSAIRGQARMIDEAYGDGDWECFRRLVSAAATLVDECAHEIWGLCVDRDETMCGGLNHLMTGQATVADAPPAPLTPAAEALFDAAAHWYPRRPLPDGDPGSPGPVPPDVSASGGEWAGSGIDPRPCTGILGAVGVGTALIGAGLLAELAHDALDQFSCGTGVPDLPGVPESPEPDTVAATPPEPDTAADGRPEPVPQPESTDPVGGPPPETETPAPGDGVPREDASPGPAPVTNPEPKHDGGYPSSGEENPGTARKVGQW